MNNEYTLKLPDLTFFKGDSITIPFEFNHPDGSPVDLRDVEVRFYLFPYGIYQLPVEFDNQKYKVALKSLGTTNTCSVFLSSQETQGLTENKYSYQPILFKLDGSDEQYVRAEGDIVFKSSYI